VVVDTNILVYAADAHSPFHQRCRAWLEERRQKAEAWHTTWGIVYEFLRVTTHPKVMRQPWTVREAWSFVGALLAAPSLRLLGPTHRHAVVAAQVITELPQLAGNVLHDAHTAILMREHGVRRIVTRDAHFLRFPFLEPFDQVA